MLFTALDGLIPEHKLPVMIAISIGNGSGDAQGSERGLEYDTMSGRYAEFVEHEVLPLVEQKAQRKVDARCRWAGDDGRQFRGVVCVDYGVVSSGALSSRADLFGDLHQSAVAV